MGWKLKKIYYNVVINSGKKLDAVFASHSTCANPVAKDPREDW
jgi:hypothetical protein